MSAGSDASAGGGPELSAVVVIGPCRGRARRVIDALCQQTAADRIEVIVVDLAPATVAPLTVAGNVRAQYIRRPDLELWSAARVVGLRAASSPIIAFIEDHCFPELDWAEALITAHRGPFAAVGYAFTTANPDSYWSRASMVNDYGLWLHPVTADPVTLMPGNNISYKRDILLQFNGELEQMLTPDYNLQQSLLGRGMLMRCEPGARAAHQGFERLLPAMQANFAYARLLASRRASIQRWPWSRRILQAILTPPLAPLLGAIRLLRSLRGRRSLLPQILAGLPIYLLVHAWSSIGETIGYLIGEGSAERDWNAFELKFDREESLPTAGAPSA